MQFNHLILEFINLSNYYDYYESSVYTKSRVKRSTIKLQESHPFDSLKATLIILLP